MTFLETIAVGLLAPLGAALGAAGHWWLQRRDRSDDREEKRRAERRGKAEEALEEVSRIVTASGERVSEALAKISGKPSETVKRVTTARLNALLSIYFPSCLPGLLEFERESREIVLKAAEDIGASPPKDFPRIQLGVASKIQKLSIEYANRLREELREEVRKLW